MKQLKKSACVYIVLGGNAMPQERAAQFWTNGGRRIGRYSNKMQAYRQYCTLRIQEECSKAGFFKEKTPLRADLYCFLSVPASRTKKFRELVDQRAAYPIVKPDNDNLYKAITDSAEGVAFANDSQIISTAIHKRYTNDNPFSVLVLSVVENDEDSIIWDVYDKFKRHRNVLD